MALVTVDPEVLAGAIRKAVTDAAQEDVTKAAEPQRYVLGIAYQAGPDPRIAKGADGGRDWFSEPELERAAWNFLRKGRRVGLFHLDGTDGSNGQPPAAEVVESYIWRGDPWDIGDGVVVTKGSWLVGMVLNPAAWKLYEQGKLGGLSPQGSAKRRTPRASASAPA